MKKRVLAFLLCAVMLIAGLPVTPLSLTGFLTASAVDGIVVDNLKELYDSIPAKAKWKSLYINYETLESWYDMAAEVLASPDSYTQSYVNSVERSLRLAYESLEYHTQKIAITQASVKVNVGSSYTLKAALEPEDAADSISWSSGNSAVVSVTPSGEVTAKKYSKDPVIITATSNGHTDTCKVYVLNPLGGVTLTGVSALYEGHSSTFKAKVVGKDSSASTTDTYTLTWDSSDPSVAAVSDSGVVTAKKKGTTVITVTAKSANGSYSAKSTLRVDDIIEISSLKATTVTTSGKVIMSIGESLDFKVSITPTNASIKDLKWSCSDTSVLTVTDKGSSGSTAIARITAKKAGTVTLKYAAKDGSGKYGYVKVTVQPRVSSISIEKRKVIALNNKTELIKVTILPKDAGNQVLSWSSSNPDICDVDYSGRLIPKSLGVCTIYVKTTDGSNLSGECRVRVASLATSISISNSTYTLKTEQSVTLKATVRTNDGSKYTDLVAWTSENPKIATVDSNGKVTGRYPGKTIIRARTIDGTEKSVVCAVTVRQPVKGISLPAKKSIGVGATYTLKPTFSPSYATNQNVKWASSNTAVATVSSSGVVTGKKVGTAVITCKSVDGGFTAKCTVSVIIATKSVSLDRTRASVYVGKSFTLKGTVSPSNATNKTLKWYSSDTSVAKVSSAGVVTGLKGGTCTITCKNSGGQSAFCKVTVVQKVTGITLNRSSISIYTGKAYTLKAKISPSTATNKGVSWSSSNSKVASVSSSGVVTGVSKGTAVIIAATVDGGFIAKCSVTVTKKVDVTAVRLNKTNISLNKGGQYLLDATVSPSNASEKGIIWSSNNTKVAKVSASGLVTAVGNGAAVITARTRDGGFTAKCTVNVRSLVTGVRVSPVECTLAKGQSRTLIANVFPEDAANRSVKWASSNAKVVSVNSKGVVTGLRSGTATITATTVDGGYSSSCDITVYIPVTGIRLSSTKATVAKGSTILLTSKVYPADASNNSVRWSSSDNSVVSVNSAGQVTGKKVGTAVVTVSTVQGNYSDNCIITVVQLAEKIELDYSSLTLYAGKTKTLGAKIKPSTTTNQTIIWSSSDKSVAKVDSKGRITAVGGGTATIKATSGDRKTAATCTVTVLQNPTQIKLSASQLLVWEGGYKKITATVLPKTSTNKSVTWKSANTKIVKVSSNGTVKGIAKGTTTVTAYASNGQIKASCKVSVVKPVTGVSLNYGSVSLSAGKKLTLKANIKPSDAYYKQVKWKSSNYDVADVSKEGTVTAKKPGYAEITATTVNGGYTAVCQVLVIQPVTSVSLNVKEEYIEVGGYAWLKAVVKPSNATDKSVTWSSSDKSIVRVSSTGKVLGVKTGTATITVKTVSGAKVASCKVHVVRKVKSITLNRSDMVLYLNKTATLKAYIAPSDATVKTVRWSSSNTSVLRVSEKGVLTPVKPGKAVVTAKTVDGGLKATCTVSVEIPATSLKISKSSLTLTAGKTYALTSSIAPSNTTNKTIRWTSSNEKVATVNSSGKITAVGGGKATITAKTSNGLTAACTVTVLKSVSSVSLNKTAVSVYTGSSVKLSASVLPSDASNKKLTWSTSNRNVASVDEAGTVRAVKAGTAVITVTTADGGFKATCKVTVLQHVTSVTLNKTSLVIKRGTETKLVASVLPSDASNKTVNWASSDPRVVSVSVSGEIIAKSIGSATVTAVTADGAKKASCVINVFESVTGVALNAEEKILYIGESATVNAVISPSDASNKSVSFVSSDASVANVGSNGKITALKVGTATITVKTADGGFTDTCKVTVRAHVSSVKLSDSAITLSRGKSHTLTYSVLPANAYNKNVKWETSDADVVSVSASGAITAKAVGEATVTVVTADGAKKASCVVTVYESVTGVALDIKEKTLYIGESVTVNASVLPAEATNKKVSFTSSDSTVAKVDANGKITALKVGTATITVKTADGGFTDTCKVTVRAHVSSIRLSDSAITLGRGKTHTLTCSVLPADAYDKTVKWETSDADIVSVSDSGVITAEAVGEATVTVVTADGAKEASCVVTVYESVTGVALDIKEKILYIGESVTVNASVLPAEATNKKVSFTSSDGTVAKAGVDGTVTALKVGTATITVKTADGGFTDTCKITVRAHVSAISLSESEINLKRGETQKLTVSVTPADSFDKSIVWESENTDVAEVENGTVTAVGRGETVITAKSVDGGFTASCKVVVTQPVTGIRLSSTELSVYTGQSVTVEAIVLPENASDKRVSFRSSDESVAEVDEAGSIRGISSGTALISAETADGHYIAVCHVTVNVTAEKIELNTAKLSLARGEKVTVIPTVLPADTFNKNVTWTSQDNEIAEVDEKGVVTAVKAGKTTIVCETVIGEVRAEVEVEVYEPVASIEITGGSSVLWVGQTTTLQADVSPEDATNKEVIWESADEQTATVENGVVTAKKAGTVDILAYSSDKKVSGKFTLTVNQQVTGIRLDTESVTLNENGEITLAASVLPENAYNKAVIWSSTDKTVATVDETGKVKAVGKGNCQITVASADGFATAQCAVQVIRPVTSVNISNKQLSLEKGETFELNASAFPADASDTSITWISSAPEVCEVGDDGTIIAKKGGQAVITAQSSNRDVYAQCAVTVEVTSTELRLDISQIELWEKETVAVSCLFTPQDVTNTSVKWVSSNSDIASVENGKITANSVGTAVITATANDSGKSASCTVKVSRKTEKVILEQTEITIENGESFILSAKVLPEDATYKTLSWTTSDKEVAVVDESGTVTAKGAGTSTITATTDQGGNKAVCHVTVTQKPNSLSFAQPSVSLSEGAKATLTVSFLPLSTTEKGLIWESSDETIATVKDGVVTAVSLGTATITVKSTADDSVFTACEINVLRAAGSVTLDKNAMTLTSGQESKLTAVIGPEGASNQAVTWTTSDESVAVVDENGLVKAVDEGTALITVTTVDGGFVDVCFVTVLKANG